MAKGIGNGCPFGAVVTTPKIAAALAQRIHFNTFGGNPVVCAQGKAVLEVIEHENLQANALKIGQPHSRRSGAAEGETQRHRRRARQRSDARHRTGERPHDERTGQGGMRAGPGNLQGPGLAARQRRSLGQTIRFSPPMCIHQQDADFMLEVLDQAFASL